MKNGTVIEYYIDTFLPKKQETFERNFLVGRDDEPARLEWHENGRIKCEEWINIVYHRIGAPAIRIWDEDGDLVSVSWYQYGSLHREDGPADLQFFKNGNIEFAIWYQKGKRHRENGFAFTEWYENGFKKIEIMFRDDKIYRKDDDHPCANEWYDDGNRKRRIACFVEEKRVEKDVHYDDIKPTVIEWYEDGITIKEKRWYRFGQSYYRENGPARIVYSKDGYVQEEDKWFSQGIMMTVKQEKKYKQEMMLEFESELKKVLKELYSFYAFEEVDVILKFLR